MALETNDVLAGLAEIINEETGIPADQVALEKSLTDDLDIDSISLVQVIVEAEGRFDVTIPESEIDNLKTVEDAVNFIVNASK